MDMENSAVNLGSGMPLSSSLRPRLRPKNLRGPGPGMVSPSPEFTDMYPEEQGSIFGKQGRVPYDSGMLEGGGDLRFYDNGVPLNVDEALDRRNPATGLEFGDEALQPLRERGMGFFDSITGPARVLIDGAFGGGVNTKGVTKSARPGSERYNEFYVEGQPDFQDQLIEQFDYPYVEDPVTGDLIIPTDKDMYSEKERTARTRIDMPAYQEIEDARGHMLGSALLSQEYGTKTAAAMGGIGEFMDYTLGGATKGDVAMDTRNNAIGRQIFLKAGIDATPQEITRLVDAEIFKQLDVIMGRSEDEQGAVAKEQPRAPANFKSPPTGPAVFYPRDEEGFYNTKRDGYE